MSRQESAASTMDEIINFHMSKQEHISGEKINELEIRFGTKGKHRTTKIQFENVIRVLKANDFQIGN